MRKHSELKEISDSLLQYELLQPPFKANGDIVSNFKNRIDCYLEAIDKIRKDYPDNETIKEVKKRSNSITAFSNKISETLTHYLNGNIKEAYNTFNQAIIGSPAMKNHIYQMTVPLTKLCNRRTPLFRVRKSENILKNRKELFHIPFSQRHLVSAQRFSVSGLPCLYLGTSIFVCWQEMGKPDFDKLYISSFITDDESSQIRILDLGYNLTSALRSTPSEHSFLFEPERIDEYNNEDYSDFPDPINDKVSKLIAWPLVLACNYTKEHEHANFHKEYIIPNLLMQWISSDSNKDISGIAYRSTKILNQKDSDIGINVILPPKMERITVPNTLYCPELKRTFKVTNPVSWAVFSTLKATPNFHSPTAIRYQTNGPAKGWIEDFDESLVEYYDNTTFRKVEVLIHQMMKHEYLPDGGDLAAES
ncbi:TPA: hypothetical protein ACJTOK_003268 [Klebsiella aerogenes]|nr:hypothetical protein [Klebsiella aerogenes]